MLVAKIPLMCVKNVSEYSHDISFERPIWATAPLVVLISDMIYRPNDRWA